MEILPPPILPPPATIPEIFQEEEEEKITDNDFDPDNCDLLCTKFYTPSSKFRHEVLPDDEMFHEMFKKQFNDPQLCNANCIEYGDDIDPNSLKYELALLIWKLPRNLWHILQTKFPTHFNPTIKLAATLLRLLLPKNKLCFTPTFNKWATQLNDLWGRLTPLLQTGPGVHVALSCIMNLTNDRVRYSLVTETDVSEMIGCYYNILRYSSFSSLSDPYKHIGNGFKKEDSPLFKEIMQVVDEIELPPTLQGTDLSVVFIKIFEGEGRDDVFRRLNFEVAPSCGEESPPLLLKIAFRSILNGVIDLTKGLIVRHLAYVRNPLMYLCGAGFASHISREVFSIISVAEVRRIALGSRFISRSHLLWAFYERGYVLPSQIRQTIKSISAKENHPPFHIYMASLELAKLFSEMVGLEHFIFSVINSDEFDKNVDTYEMQKFIPRYEEFLKALDNQSSRKRLRSG